MAYQNVGTPRFYINVIEWQASLGAAPLPSGHYRTLPVNPSAFNGYYQAGVVTFNAELNNPFCAILGHTGLWNLAGDLGIDDDALNWEGTTLSSDLLINESASYHGWSLVGLSGTPTRIAFTGNIGSIIVGSYYDLPHSPDLKLTMTREMDGVKRVRTKGGSDLVAHKYIKPEMWGEAGAWELYLGIPGDEQKLSRSGRRTWGLSFSQLGGDDVFGSNQSLSQARFDQTDGIDESDTGLPVTSNYKYNVLTDDNFYSQVIHKTNGGQLPFIFQPDSSNNNPDGFAICKFDMNTFKFNQVANGVYNVKCKIREVW